MKRVFLAAGIMLTASVITAQSLQFSKTEYLFPTLLESDKEITYVFTFTNKSSERVDITGVVCSQKNIRITWNKDTIGKKESSGITVIINPKSNVGVVNAVIRLSTLEKGKTVEYTLRVKGEVLEREKTKQEIYGMKEGNLRYKTNTKNNCRFSPTSVLVDTFFFYNEWTDTMTFIRGNLPAPIEVVELTPRLAPLEDGIVVFRYKAEVKKDWGFMYDRFTIYTNDPERPEKTFTVMGDLYDDFDSWTPEQLKKAPKIQTSEDKYNFGTVNEGEVVAHTFTITNAGKSKLYIRKTKTTCGCTVGKPEKDELEPGESTSVKASFRTQGKLGGQSRPIDIITNDPERPKTTLTIEGHVVKAPPKE
ncbi:MAG: DUF1573 domain-containing protein [Lentimicrobiaceae bacterium]|nr:DUF1573 domain-containing protein [Lentimicrobiaceae bacterium]